MTGSNARQYFILLLISVALFVVNRKTGTFGKNKRSAIIIVARSIWWSVCVLVSGSCRERASEGRADQCVFTYRRACRTREVTYLHSSGECRTRRMRWWCMRDSVIASRRRMSVTISRRRGLWSLSAIRFSNRNTDASCSHPIQHTITSPTNDPRLVCLSLGAHCRAVLGKNIWGGGLAPHHLGGNNG